MIIQPIFNMHENGVNIKLFDWREYLTHYITLSPFEDSPYWSNYIHYQVNTTKKIDLILWIFMK